MASYSLQVGVCELQQPPSAVTPWGCAGVPRTCDYHGNCAKLRMHAQLHAGQQHIG